MGFNMLEQLQAMKAKMDESKAKLEQIIVEGEAANGIVKVSINGNRKVKNVTIDKLLLEKDIEEIEDLLTIAFNNAIENAEKINANEIQNSAQNLLSGLK